MAENSRSTSSVSLKIKNPPLLTLRQVFNFYGGDGGSRTHVRKSFVPKSTCLERSLV